MVKGLMPRPDTAILEVGCGSGLMYEALAAQVGNALNYRGVDNSEEMLRLARKRIPFGHVAKGDAFNLVYADNAFDIVLCFEVLGHMPDNQGAINELFRVAKDKVVITYWATWGKDITAGADHYEYPRQDMLQRIAIASKGIPHLVEERQMPYTLALFITKKGGRQ